MSARSIPDHKRIFRSFISFMTAGLILIAAIPSQAVSQDYEDGYMQGVADSCAGIYLIAPEEYTFVLNLSKHKIHEVGKK